VNLLQSNYYGTTVVTIIFPDPIIRVSTVYTMYICICISLIPRHSKIREECLVSTVHTCSSPGFSGNLETVILVRVSRPYTTELPESLQSSVHSTIEQAILCTLSKVVKPGIPIFLCACEFNLMSYMEKVMEMLVHVNRGYQALLSNSYECLGMYTLYVTSCV